MRSFLDTTPQLAMIESAALWPAHPGWARLRSVRRAGDHLFQRHQLEEAG